MKWAWLGFVLAGGIVFFYAWMGRGYPWQFALVAGMAIGSLLYTAIRVAEQLRPILLVRRSPVDRPSVNKAAPGEGDEGKNKK